MPRVAFWHKVPFGLADCAATIRFRHTLRAGPLSHAYLTNLWGWCGQNNRTMAFSGEFGAACIADAAGWRGKALRFLGALTQSGFATMEGDRIVLVDPLKACVREFDALPSGVGKGADQGTKGSGKGSRKEPKGSGKGAEGDAKGSGKVQQPEAGQAQRGPETPFSARAHAGETQTETGEEVQEQDPSSGRPNSPSPPAERADDEGQLPGMPPPTAPTVEKQITEVLADWRDRFSEMPGAAIEGKAAGKRRARIRARFLEGWTVERLKTVVSGAMLDAFLVGTDPKSKPGGYREVSTVFRDNAQCERLTKLANSPPMPARAPPREPERPRPPLYVAPPPSGPPTPEALAARDAAMAMFAGIGHGPPPEQPKKPMAHRLFVPEKEPA